MTAARALVAAALFVAGASCSSPTEVERFRDVDLSLLLHWPDGADPLTATRLSATSLFVELRDEGGTLVASTTAAITPSDDSIPFTIAVPMDTVRESFDLRLRLSAGGTVLFQAAQLVTLPDAGVHPQELLLAYAGPGHDAVEIALTPSRDTIPATSSLALDAVLRNPASAVVSTPVHWTVSDAARGTITQEGIFTGLGMLGEVTVTALAATGHSAQATLLLRAAADEMEAMSGDSQTSVPTLPFPTPLAVRILRAGAPVADADVAWSVALGSATISNVTPTGADGISSVTVNAGSTAGGVVIRAAVDGQETFFYLDVTAGPPAILAEVITGSTTLNFATRAIRRPLELRLTDAQGNAVAGVPVQYTVTSGGGSVPGGGPRISAIDGRVAIDWVLGANFGDQTLNAATPCTPEGGCVSFDITVAARLISFITREIASGDDQVGAQGSPFAEPVRFRISDQGVGIANVPVRISTVNGAASFGDSVRFTDAQGEVALSVTPLTPGPIQVLFRVAEPGSAFSLQAELLATPVGYSHTWLGVTSDWSAGSNWSSGSVPTAGDSVFVPPGTPAAPSLTADATIASMYHEDERPMALGGHILTVHGSLRTTSSITGPGLVEMTGTQRFVGGDISALKLHGITTLAEESTFGRLELEAGSELKLGTSGSFGVSDSAIFRGGFPRMGNALNYVTIHHAVFESGTMPDDMMTAGTLAITGDLLVPGSLRTFGEHEVVFQHRLPLVARRLAIADAGPSATRIQRLSINSQGSMPVVVEGGLHVVGPMYVAGVLEVAEGVHAEIGGVLTVGVGSIVRVLGTMSVGACDLPNGPVLLIGFSCPAP